MVLAGVATFTWIAYKVVTLVESRSPVANRKSALWEVKAKRARRNVVTIATSRCLAGTGEGYSTSLTGRWISSRAIRESHTPPILVIRRAVLGQPFALDVPWPEPICARLAELAGVAPAPPSPGGQHYRRAAALPEAVRRPRG